MTGWKRGRRTRTFGRNHVSDLRRHDPYAGFLFHCYSRPGPVRGPLLYRDTPDAIGVLESPTNHMPVGMALAIGPDGAGVAVWRLSVHGAELPGRWVVIDCAFRPAQ
jgi:hypothetical protein